MLKIEEYVLPNLALRGLSLTISEGTPAVLVDESIAALWRTLDESLMGSGLRPSRRFGLSTSHRRDALFYIAAIEEVPGLPVDLAPFSFEGGYYLCAEHPGSLGGLRSSMDWFYDRYLPSAPYDSREGYFVELFDPRFSPDAESSILTFGRPVRRLTR
jgi:predicted transcriptional regulator YdeE